MTRTNRTRRTLAAAATLALALGGVLITATPASATPSTVTNTNDSGAGSLRDAIDAANSDTTADTITITATGTLTLVTALPSITEPVQILGPSGGFTIDAAATGAGEHGLFVDGTATPGIDATIRDLTVTNADNEGIRSQSADLTLTRVTLTDNGDNGYYGDFGNLSLTDVTTEDNNDDGLDIELDGSYSATILRLTSTGSASDGVDAILDDGASLTITDSGITGNDGAGIRVLATDDSTVRITGSTLGGNNYSDNSECGGGVNANVYGSLLEIGDTTIEENDAEFGGGICLDTADSEVTLHDLVVYDNYSADGAGIYLDFFTGPDPVIIEDSAIIHNHAEGDGAGINIDDAGDDGDYAGIQILRTTIDDNWAEGDGGGISITDLSATGFDDTPGVLVKDSTISNNYSEEDGGGLWIANEFFEADEAIPSVVIQNSTFSGNSAEEGGGSISATTSTEEGDYLPIELHVLNTTVTQSLDDGQIAEIVIRGDIHFELANSIVSDNAHDDLSSESTPGDDPTGTIDYSMVGVIHYVGPPVLPNAFSAGTGNILSDAPGLGPLADNGGPTLTHLPQTNSPAVEAGDPAFSGLAYDQRGLDRVVNRLDMGSVELQPHLASTGVGAVAPLVGGVLLLGVGAVLVGARRRRAAR